MERLLLKWETAKRLLPLARIKLTNAEARLGVVFYGSTTPAAYEVIDILRNRGIAVNSMRIRAFPFQQEVMDFVLAHELVFIIEQNRDGQMRTLLDQRGQPAAAQTDPHYKLRRFAGGQPFSHPGP